MPKTKTPPTELVDADKISLDDADHHDGLMFDQWGNINCLLGYMPKQREAGDMSYYSLQVADRDVDGRSSRRFVHLDRGTISAGPFAWPDRQYRFAPEYDLHRPTNVDPYFGVLGPDGEDVELTRQLYGATFDEVKFVAITLATTRDDRISSRGTDPRITVSRSRDNTCSFTGCLIPQNFPFVAFGATQYMWGHVSLHGLFKMLAFHVHMRGATFEHLMDTGVDEKLLQTLVENTSRGFHYTPLRSVNER